MYEAQKKRDQRVAILKEIAMEKEQSTCTFAPKTNSSFKKKNDDYSLIDDQNARQQKFLEANMDPHKPPIYKVSKTMLKADHAAKRLHEWGEHQKRTKNLLADYAKKIQQDNEMSECSFKPKTIQKRQPLKSSKSHQSMPGQTKFLERQL